MNWPEYNKNLVKRGNINFWLPEDIASWWYNESKMGRGRPLVYSDRAIEACLTISYLFGLPLRMTEGFLNSFFEREKLPVKCPCYTQLSRRAPLIKIPEIKVSRGQQLHLAFDSTGLKVFGEGEWKVRTHGTSKRRIWRKLHIALDVKSLLIPEVALTTCSIDDAEVASQMLTKKFDGCVERIFGDGAYDKTKMYKAARRVGAQLLAPPAHNAKQQHKIIDPAKLPRDNAIARIRMLGNNQDARKQWKKESGYHQRSLAETTMYRFKTTFSDRLKHRLFENQSTEIAIKAKILNKFASIGFAGAR
jgi:hypothetical protein